MNKDLMDALNILHNHNLIDDEYYNIIEQDIKNTLEEDEPEIEIKVKAKLRSKAEEFMCDIEEALEEKGYKGALKLPIDYEFEVDDVK